MDQRYNMNQSPVQYGDYPQYGNPTVQYREYPTQQPYTPKTAINELDSFLSGLPEVERMEVFSHPEFASEYSDFLSKFMFYLLQSDVGAGYISSSEHRRTMAERLKLVAHHVYSDSKKSQTTELERLMKENEALKKKLAKDTK